MDLDDVRPTFILESRELLQQMEDELLHLQHAMDDPEVLNAIFRAAHTIKGAAGVFGFDAIVAFTHVAESVLDRLRNGDLIFNEELIALFLRVCDHIGVLINLVAEGGEPDAEVARMDAGLIAEMQCYLVPQPDELSQHPATLQAPSALERDAAAASTDNWHISLRFNTELLRNGMDPLAILRYLTSLGRIVSIIPLIDAVPQGEALVVDTCYLGFEIAFASDKDRAIIEDAFEFVRDGSLIRILPPRSRMSEYLALIQALPEQDMRLGEILVSCGSLTEAELKRVLHEQADESGKTQRPIGQVLVDAQMVHPPIIEAALEKQQRAKDHRGAENNSIRVEAAKLDQHINLIGELIIASAGARLAAQRSRTPALVEVMATLSRLVEDIRDSALTLRMVQIGATFNRFQRVVHDVSHELGKEIALVIRGAETELDKTLVEKIGDPLMHLVRNAMDHGIEPATVRLLTGKPAQGTVNLNAYHDAGGIVIEVSDDGGGLQRDKILRKAIERGLVGENEHLSEQEIFNLIFEPGFSTADQISNLSGRGVGMDVVKRNIQALRGSIDLDSTAGQGTCVRIRLPLTLAIIDGFLIESGGGAYVIPLDTVVECIELGPQDNKTAPRRDYLDLRGQVLPLIRLREMFAAEGEPARRENVVVVQCAGQRAGLVVDKLLGEFQTVIKPLGKVFRLIKGIGGFTILGSGDVALVLDVHGLVRNASSQQALRGTGRETTQHPSRTS